MNGILLVDKPRDFTSHDVVAKLRGILHERRIGHSGTLDPLATGLLVVFIGRATRAVEFAESQEKEYIASLRPGMTTDTQDITGTVLTQSGKSVTEEDLLSVLPEFTGEIMQLPPMYSAIKIGGKKLCDVARRGGEVERKPRSVTIKELEYLGREDGDFNLRVVCSKGTYIRTLCSDIGEKLGTGAVMSGLRRTRCGDYSVENALTIGEIESLAASGGLSGHIMPADSIFSEYPEYVLTGPEEKKCLCGNSFPSSLAPGNYRVYDRNGEFMMLASADGAEMKVIKSFFEVPSAQ